MEGHTPRIGRDLTTGNIFSNVLYMGVPSMIGFAAMTVYGLTDMFWVARIGTPEVAGVTLFNSFAWVLGSVNSLVGTGSVAVIARRFGERDFAGTSNAIEQTMVMKFLMGIPMGVVGFFAVGKVLGMMTREQDLVRIGAVYGRVYFAGLPFMFTSYTVYTGLRGIGDAPRAMYIMLFSVILNMVLDPVFIFALKMGVQGAAVATVISAVCAVGIGLYVLRYGESNLRIGLKRYRLDLKCMGQILAIGFPAFVDSIARSVAYWVFAIFVAVFGAAIVASYGICARIMEFGIVFAVGLELGSSAIVGQNLGAGKPDRAEHTARNAALLALGISAAISLVEIIFGRHIMGVFGKSADVQAQGAEVLKYFAIAQPFTATAIALSSAFYGAGNTWPPTIAALVALWGVQIPLAALFVHTFRFGPNAMWVAMILSGALFLSILVMVFRMGKWKHRVV